MNYAVAVFALLLGLSLGGNVHLFIKLRKSIKSPAPTQDAKALLAAIMRGQAVLDIRVLDAENLMVRSPRR